MNTIKTIVELNKQIRPLIKGGFTINSKYELGNSYAYEKVGADILLLTMKNVFFDKRCGQYKNMSKIAIDKAFRKLTRELGAEVMSPPVNMDISYEDGLRWLYHHYPYGEGNFTNTVLVNGQDRILAVQYNACKHTRMIQIDTSVDTGYIVLNNKKKLEGRYFYKNFAELIPVLQKLFYSN